MDEIYKLALNGGTAVLLAYFVLKWQREDGKARADECKHCALEAKAWAEQERGDKETMRSALESNTRAITVLTEMVKRVFEGGARHESKREGVSAGPSNGGPGRDR